MCFYVPWKYDCIIFFFSDNSSLPTESEVELNVSDAESADSIVDK